jgi:uncharacterized protein (DUF362 family)
MSSSSPSGKGEVFVRPRVVQIHNAAVCDWNYVTGNYVESIDFGTVKKMMSAGLTAFSGADSPAAAWKKIIRPYRRGDKIVIKPNLNNTRIGYSQAIMTSPQVIQALVESLLEAGYPAGDIIIYDLTAYKGQAVTNRLAGLGVETVFLKENRSVLDKVATKLHLGPAAPDTDAPIQMHMPVRDGDGNDVRCYMPKVLTGAQHLINVPVFKAHQFVLQSNALKNHFGTVRFSNNNSHPVALHGAHIDWHIADINTNPHIRNKTRLVIVDALLGAGCFFRGSYGRIPSRWKTWPQGDTPNSLFFSAEPVAIESVIADLISREQMAMGYEPHSHRYLHIAAEAGLGVHEHRDEHGEYHKIGLQYISI